MTRRIISLLVCVMMLAGCGLAAAENGTPITLTDMAGREITLDAPARRLVVLQPGDFEILWALGAMSLVVGRGEYVDYPAEAADIPSVQSGYETNLETIIALEPDAVVMTAMSQTEEQVNALSDAGIAVVVTDAQTLEDVYTAIRLLGALTGREAQAGDLESAMRDSIAACAEKAAAAGAAGKTFYYEESPLQWGLWAGGKGIFFDDLCTAMGLTNIFADLTGHNAVSEEQVLERNPDYIFTTMMYYGTGETPAEEIMHRAGWEDVTAVKNGDILYDDTSSIARPGPRLVDAAELILNLILGEDADAA